MIGVRYKIVERVLDVPLENPAYPGFFMGAYKTVIASWTAEHAIIYRPNIKELGDTPLVRVNSACFTGDIFGDRRCDCTEQMFAAMNEIVKKPGLVIYHFHHEGRGLGFTDKLITYKRMKDENVSTFDAMKSIANTDDLRTYSSAILILNDLGIKRIRLMTNNPCKKKALEDNGIEIVDTVPLIISRPEIRCYLECKRNEQGHAIQFPKEAGRPTL